MPPMRGAIDIAAEFNDVDEEYDAEKRLKDLVTNLSTISEDARIITIWDQNDDSITIVKEKSYVRARFMSDEISGLASNPRRVKLLPTNLKIYIFEFNRLRTRDILNAFNMKFHETAEQILFKFRTYENEIPSDYLRYFTFQQFDEPNKEM